LPYCANCGKETLATDKFCPSCGQSIALPTAESAAPSATIPTTQPAAQFQSNQHLKSPLAAAFLNLFLPGTGYVYVGMGRNIGEMIFGTLVFLFYFVGFEVTFVAELFTYTPSVPTSTGSVSPYDALIFLVFLLPFAFAYDGYRRAR